MRMKQESEGWFLIFGLDELRDSSVIIMNFIVLGYIFESDRL
jgi:hypothetical protein